MTSSDDHYTLFVNGREIGSGHCRNDNTPGRASFVFTVGLDPESRNVVAIAGENSAASAGLIATIHVDYSDGTSKPLLPTLIGRPYRLLLPVDGLAQAIMIQYGPLQYQRDLRQAPLGSHPLFLPS